VIITLLLGLVLTAAAVTLVARAFVVSRLRATEMLGHIGHYGFAGRLDLSRIRGYGLRSLLDEAASGLGALLTERFKLYNEEHLRKQLVSAGMYRTSPRMLIGYQLLSAVALPGVWIWLAVLAGMGTAITLLGAVLAAGIGWIGPTSTVRQRSDARIYKIDYAMPELIDLLVVTVEAGLSLTAALQLAATRLKGPLGDELRIVLQEQRMGLPPVQALENMLLRCPTPAVEAFVRAMVQGQLLGVSVGQILRSLALEMRKRRRAKAEERAQKAPIKILFPLIFMIFPAMFVVILGPAVVSVFHALKS
jgi:tight adherence protein C